MIQAFYLSFLMYSLSFLLPSTLLGQGIKQAFRESTFTHTSGQSKSLEEILESHKGKVVYVDFWASWCTPCIREMRHSAKLAKDYADEELVFVFLSVDNSISSWKKALKKIATSKEAEHYNRPMNASKTLTQALRLRSIPRYMLFDKEGKPLDLDAYPPSEAECKEAIDKALAQ